MACEGAVRYYSQTAWPISSPGTWAQTEKAVWHCPGTISDTLEWLLPADRYFTLSVGCFFPPQNSNGLDHRLSKNDSSRAFVFFLHFLFIHIHCFILPTLTFLKLFFLIKIYSRLKVGCKRLWLTVWTSDEEQRMKRATIAKDQNGCERLRTRWWVFLRPVKGWFRNACVSITCSFHGGLAQRMDGRGEDGGKKGAKDRKEALSQLEWKYVLISTQFLRHG